MVASAASPGDWGNGLVVQIVKPTTDLGATTTDVINDPLSERFDLLVYADKDSTVPLEWEDSDARMIEEGAANNVRLRSVTTKVHRVDAMVSYRTEPDDIC
jgi:mitotic spindle assembly checkpoint protein MAD2